MLAGAGRCHSREACAVAAEDELCHSSRKPWGLFTHGVPRLQHAVVGTQKQLSLNFVKGNHHVLCTWTMSCLRHHPCLLQRARLCLSMHSVWMSSMLLNLLCCHCGSSQVKSFFGAQQAEEDPAVVRLAQLKVCMYMYVCGFAYPCLLA